jgi:endonuclease/exonuclease/phosphatase family metal-dependent hydrolase
MLVMSYNIQGHAAGRRPDHLPKIAETIAAVAPDVVGLQEVHCRTRPSAMVDQAATIAHLTGYSFHFGQSCRMDGGDYGNAVLTRGRIEEATVHALPGGGEPRSLLQVRIDLDGTRLDFFVTHLAAWGRLLRNARLQQIATLGDLTARGTLPHILVGDFNVTPPAEEMKVLLSHGHLRLCGDTLEPTFPLTRSRLDYIFCDERFELTRQQVVKRGPSDHWPLVAEMTLRVDG